MPPDVPPVPTHDLSLALKVGELDGKLSAVTERQSRHEVWVGAKLDSMDGKLDQIAVSLAQSAGRASFLKGALSPAMWLISASGGLVAWLVTHFVYLHH